MICFKIFKPQSSQRKNYKRKFGVPCVFSGEKIRDWPTNRLSHK
jgi:tRNA A37 threonylcarbamoyladenosine dehydratase